MNKKFMGLVFVVIICGCHAPAQSAVCPSYREQLENEEIEELKKTMNMSEEEAKKFDRDVAEGRERARRNQPED